MPEDIKQPNIRKYGKKIDDKFDKKLLDEQRNEEKKQKLHNFKMLYIDVICISVLFFYESFFIIWFERCFFVHDNWKDRFVLMFNDMTWIGTYLMTAIISVFITNILSKRLK